MKIIEIVIQIIENSLTLRVAGAMAFLMPTGLFYMMITVVAKDPTSFLGEKEKDIEREKARWLSQTVRQKKWSLIIEWPRHPMLYKRINIMKENINIRENSLLKMRNKKVNSFMVPHQLNTFFGLLGDNRKMEEEETKRTVAFLRRNGPETFYGKTLNGVISAMLLLNIILVVI